VEHRPGPAADAALPPGAAEALSRLVSLLAASPHNLVSRRERTTLAEVHVPECIGVATVLDPAPGSAWLDLGTGGGLPGLVLAIVRPDVHWTLVDATAKKVAAVQGFIAELGLRNARAIAGRAERLAREEAHRERYDGVVSRALARLVVAAELSRGFVRDGGVVAAVKGPRWREELAEAEPAMGLLRLQHVGVTPVPGAVRRTVVVTMRADGPVPPAYPRRDGLPASAPLGRRASEGVAQ